MRCDLLWPTGATDGNVLRYFFVRLLLTEYSIAADLSVDETGIDRDHANTLSDVFDRGRTRQANDAVVGSNVGSNSRGARLGADRGVVSNCTASLALHVAQLVLEYTNTMMSSCVHTTRFARPKESQEATRSRALEGEAESELHLARGIDHRLGFSSVWIVYTGNGICVLWRVGRVKHLPAELQTEALPETERLHQARVKSADAVAAQNVPAGVAKAPYAGRPLRQREGFRVEPVVLGRIRDERIADKVRAPLGRRGAKP